MNANLQADLAYLKDLAEAGKKTPLVGGDFGIMWGGLYALSALFAYAVLSGVIAAPNWAVLAGFLAPAPIGTLGNIWLARKMRSVPGANSFGNKTSAAAWAAVGMTIFVLFASVFGSAALGLLHVPEAAVWGALQVAIFTGYGVAYATTAQATGMKDQFLFAGLSVLAAGATIPTMGTLNVFLVMAVGLIASAVLPGLWMRMRQPKETV